MSLKLHNFIADIKRLECEIIDEIVNKNLSLNSIPEILLSQKVCVNAVFKSVDNFDLLPFRLKDDLVCLLAAQIKPSNQISLPSHIVGWVTKNSNVPILSLLSDDIKSDFICKQSIKLNHTNIEYLPEKYFDENEGQERICEFIQINPKVISVLDKKYITNEVCEFALCSDGFSLSYLPLELRKREYCEKAFKRNYIEVIHFPKEFINVGVVREALSKCDSKEVSKIIRLLKEWDWTDDLIIEGMKKDENIFSSIPYDKITTELMFKVGEYIERYDLLFHVPENVFNENLNYFLISKNPLLLGGMPERERTRPVCIEAVSRNGLALEHVPKIVQNDEVYHVAINNNGLALKYVPVPYRDEELPKNAVNQNGEAIEYVPYENLNEVLCRVAVANNPHAIFKIKKEFLNNELLHMAIKSLPHALKLIPVDERTEELCIIAFEKDAGLYEYIPVQMRKNQKIMNLAKKYGIVKDQTDLKSKV